MSRVYILARNGREARAVAEARGLKPSEWALYTELAGRGLVGATLLMTPCWAHGLDGRRIIVIESNIAIGRMRVRRVRCP